MKPSNSRQHIGRQHFRTPGSILFPVLSLIVVTAVSARADSGTWTGATDATWASTGNWSGITTTVPGAGDTATFNGASSNTTVDLGAGVTLGSLLFDTSSAAAYTIGSGAVGSQILTLGTVGNAVTMNSTVASNELINSNLALDTTGTYVFTNDSLTNTLTVAGGISASTAGTKVLNVTGSGNTAINGAITSGSGAVGLLKLGTGTLTLSGGGTLNGTFTGYGATSPVVIRGGTTDITSGAYSASGETIVGGVTTNGETGVNTNLTMDGGSFTITSFLSLGRGNGTGTVSSDIVMNNSSAITANNFSAGFNAGSTLNLPKGTFTLNGSSAFTVATNGQFTFAESAGSNMTMTLNGTSSVTLNGTSSNRTIGGGTGTVTLASSGATFTDNSTNRLNVGYQNGTGTVNVNAGTFSHPNGELVVAGSNANGTFTGTGIVNVAGGTLNTKSLTVGRNNNNVASTLNGTVNVTSGTMNVTAGNSLVGWQGQGTSGTLNISGGTFNQSTVSSASANLVIGSFTGVTGAVNVSGTGTLNIDNGSSINFSDSAGFSPTGILTISGGNIAFYSDAGTTAGGTGVVDLMKNTGTGTNTLNLNGGTLAANQVKATNSTGTRILNFNGGTLKSSSNTLGATFLASGTATTANVRNGGAIIDTNGNSVTIGQALVHSTIGGDAATDGGLTKNGLGTLTLGTAATYTGATTVNAGTLVLPNGVTIASTALSVGAAGTFDVSAQSTYSLSSHTITFSLDGSSIGVVNAGSLAVDLTGAALTLNLTTGTPAASYDFLTSTSAATGDLASVTLVGSLSGTLTKSGNTWSSSNVGGYSVSLDQTSGAVTFTAVPEPSVVALVAVGLFGALTFRRRRTAMNG
jgi:autotransporter-associated beta strand protein